MLDENVRENMPLAGASGHPSELALHQHLVGSSLPEQRETVAQHVQTCRACAGALAGLQSAQDEFSRGAGARIEAALAHRPTIPWRRRVRVPLLALFALPVAAALLLRLGPGPRSPDQDLLPKGPATPAGKLELEVFARRGTHVFAVGPGAEPLHAGDAVRFALRWPARLSYVLVLGVDGAGAINLYYPYGAADAARLPEGPARLELPGSIVLDDSAGPERIFALFAAKPFTLASVRGPLGALAARGPEALRRESQLEAAVDGQATILLEKSRAP
jgi:hypothetical protein